MSDDAYGPEMTDEDICGPDHHYFADQEVDGAHGDLTVVGRCYCGAKLYPAGGPS